MRWSDAYIPLNLLDGFGLHVSPAHFGSHGFGRVAPNLGIPIEHSWVNRNAVQKASHLVGCFLVRGFDDRVFLFVHVAAVADAAVELARQ